MSKYKYAGAVTGVFICEKCGRIFTDTIATIESEEVLSLNEQNAALMKQMKEQTSLTFRVIEECSVCYQKRRSPLE